MSTIRYTSAFLTCLLFWSAIAAWNHTLQNAPSQTTQIPPAGRGPSQTTQIPPAGRGPTRPTRYYTANYTSQYTLQPQENHTKRRSTMQLELSTLTLLAGIFVLAFLAETLTEYFARPFLRPETLPGNHHQPIHIVPAWLLRYIAAGVGVALAIAYRADLLAIFGLIAWSPWIGYVVTGLVIGRGANYLNDVVGRWLAPLP